MKDRVLVVGHELGDRAAIARALQLGGYAVELSDNPKRALKLAEKLKVKAAVVALGDGIDWETVRALRSTVSRILALVDPGDEGVKLNRDVLPADAILLRPLKDDQLLGRLAGLKTFSPIEADDGKPHYYWFDDCRLDMWGRTFVDALGRETELTRSEAELLLAFIRNAGRVLNRDQLRLAVTGHGCEVYDRSVDILIGRLRRKVEPDPKLPRFIVTVWGAGYKFAAAPRGARGSTGSGSAPASHEANVIDSSAQAEEQNRHVEKAAIVLAPERRQVTVLCCGLASPTVLTGHDDLEDIGRAVDFFQQAAATAVAQLGGSIMRSMGEEVLALFGYPHAHEDDAERAVQAGLDLLARIVETHSPAGNALQAQIVIATGKVLVRQVGEVIGEAPIIATRLRVSAPLNEVIITETTRKLIGGVYQNRHHSKHAVDGIRARVSTYLVLSGRRAGTRFEAFHSQQLTPFVGRSRELGQLRALWRLVKSGKGRVALLCGEPGVGKSRMFHAFLDIISGDLHDVVRCQCSLRHMHRPFHPIIDYLENAAGFQRDDSSEEKLTKLARVLCLAPSSTDLALFGALLSIPTADRGLAEEMSPKRQKDLIIGAVIRHVFALAHLRPVVVKLADSHWADSCTIELFDKIAGSLVGARVFVLVTFRPGFFTQWLDHGHVSILQLNRLEREQVRDIIGHIAGGKLSARICEQIVAKTDGVPLFVEELTKSIIERSDDGDPRDYERINLRSSGIPDTLADSLMARLDKVGQAKEIAQIGSAIGREFSFSLLAEVAQVPNATLCALVAQLVAADLVFVRGEPPHSTYAFKHALIQDAAYATLPISRLRQLHGNIARVLEEKFPDVSETQPELVAHHFAEAGIKELAISHLHRAGQRAVEYSAHKEAVEHLSRALELLQSLAGNDGNSREALALHALLSHATIAMHGYAAPRTKEILLQARALLDIQTDGPERFPVLYGIWAADYVGGISSEQKAAANRFLAEAKRQGDAATLSVGHRIVGSSWLTSGDFGTAHGHLEQARGLYDPLKHSNLRHRYGQDIGVAAQCYFSWALWHEGLTRQAGSVADTAFRLAEELSHPHTLVYAICHARCFIDFFSRNADDLQRDADLVVSLCTEHGFSHWINCGRIFQGWATICREEHDQGMEVLRAGIAGWRERGARLWLPTFLTMEAEACAMSGCEDEALGAIERSLAIVDETGERWWMSEILRIKARILFKTGKAEVDEVEALLLSGLDIARAQSARCFELRTACDLARIRKGRGKDQDTLSLLLTACGKLTEVSEMPDLQQAKEQIRMLQQGITKQ